MSRAFAMSVIHETHQAWAKLIKCRASEEQTPEVSATAFSPQLKGMKRSTLKRNLSVPSLAAMACVEHSLLSDEEALKEALHAASTDQLSLPASHN
jgi:hypothetical protein